MNYELRLNRSRIPHQGRFWKSGAREKALITGYGGGKTKIGAAEIIKHTIQDPGFFHMAVSPTFPMAKKTVIPTIIETLEKNFFPPLIEGRDWDYNKSDHYFHIKPWDGRIWVASGDNPSSLKGPNLASFWMDEPGLMDEQVHTEMIGRLRAPGAKNPQGFYTGTPEGFGYLQELCEGSKRPKNFELIRGKTTDNPYLPSEYIQALIEQYDEVLVRAYINGEFVNMAGGSAYYGFSEDNKLDFFEVNPRLPLIIGMDFNYDPFCMVIGQEAIIKGKRSIVIFDEFALHNCDTDAAIGRLIEKYGDEVDGVRREYMIYPDPACQNRSAHGVGKTDLSMIRQAMTGNLFSVRVKSAAPKRKDRLNAVNAKFKNSLGERTLYVTRNCKTLIRDVNTCTMDEYLNGNFKDKTLGHITDGLGYAIDYMYPIVTGAGRHASNTISI